ncbi:MAG: hypothetical protein HY731_12630 [Candidatus Tectomicrobia bacterium]|nr:hypothetical protein [Candidatus Tectomicrobia bacterium]
MKWVFFEISRDRGLSQLTQRAIIEATSEGEAWKGFQNQGYEPSQDSSSVVCAELNSAYESYLRQFYASSCT